MTHMGPMSDSAGCFSEPKLAKNCPCRKCKLTDVFYRIWESNCGGYEDLKFECRICGATWWVDGIDS